MGELASDLKQFPAPSAEREQVPMTLVRPGRRLGDSGSSARFLVTPSRPGALLADAADRKLPVR